jgi:hypothetical protein
MAVAAALAGFAVVPAWADEAAEVSTASQHAGMAAGSADIKMVHMHLHHVVNCLVGPSGPGFDKAAGNPCDGKGNGAIADGGDKMKLGAAVAKAEDGIKSDDLAMAKKDAGEAQAMLK